MITSYDINSANKLHSPLSVQQNMMPQTLRSYRVDGRPRSPLPLPGRREDGGGAGGGGMKSRVHTLEGRHQGHRQTGPGNAK